METLQFYDFLSPSEKKIDTIAAAWLAITLVVPLVVKLFLLIKTGKIAADRTTIIYATFIGSLGFGLFLVSGQRGYQAYGRGEEGRKNLAEIYQLQIQYFGEHNTYAGRNGHNGTGCFTDLNWRPKASSIYSYYCGDDQIPRVYPKDGVNYDPDSNWPIAAKPMSTRNSFTIIAIGNIDQDPDLDVWMFNDSKTMTSQSRDFIDGSGPQLVYKHFLLLTSHIDSPLRVFFPYLVALVITPLLFASLFIDCRRYLSSARKDDQAPGPRHDSS